MFEVIGDLYLIYLNEFVVNDLNESLFGDFEGIGVIMIMKDGELVVVEVFVVDFLVEKVGIKEGDIIEKVDGIVIKGMKLVEVVLKVWGKKGIFVELII